MESYRFCPFFESYYEDISFNLYMIERGDGKY